MGALMKFELEGHVYEKYPKSSIVNIYFEGVEVDVFTNYDIGSDFDKFEESCREHLDYLKESHGY